MIKAIISDYGGVLVEKPLKSARVGEVLQTLNISIDELQEGLYGKNREIWNKTRVGLISEETHWQYVSQNLNLSSVQTAWVRHQLYETVDVRLKLLDFLKTLYGKYKFAILTNAIPSYLHAAKEVQPLFEVVINSYETGIAKPNIAIFELSVTSLHAAPTECVFIDDELKNIEVANDLGFHTIQYQTPSHAIRNINVLLNRQD